MHNTSCREQEWRGEEGTGRAGGSRRLWHGWGDEDDGEGEWITPSNVGLHKSRALDLLPSEGQGRKGKAKVQETILVGCLTADFAMQNVLLQMGLGLVGVEGKRIERVKSWVLRCHACFKYVSRASQFKLPYKILTIGRSSQSL